MKRVAMLSAVAAVLMTVGLDAQGRNFAGTWVVDAEKTTAAGGGGGGRGGGGAIAATGTTERRIVAAGGGGGAMVSSGGSERVAVAAAGAGGGGARVVASGLALTVDANTFTMVNGATTTAYKLDGSVTNIESPRGKSTAKATWQGDKIAIETTSEGPNGSIMTHATWYLEGESLVRENKSTGPDGQEVVRKTYYKRS